MENGILHRYSTNNVGVLGRLRAHGLGIVGSDPAHFAIRVLYMRQMNRTPFIISLTILSPVSAKLYGETIPIPCTVHLTVQNIFSKLTF